MVKITALCATTLLSALPGGTAAAADTARGKTLLEANCFHCHDAAFYTRPDRKVKDFKGLEKQVRRCELNLELQWFDEDIAAVVGYLNDTYYKFKP